MKDIKINTDTKQLIIENNDLGYVSDSEELRQTIFNILNKNLSAFIVNNEIEDDVILGRNQYGINFQKIISTILTENDSRISGVEITSNEFDTNTRSLYLEIKILLGAGQTTTIGGYVNA